MFVGQCYDCDSYACAGTCQPDLPAIGSERATATDAPPNSPATQPGSKDNKKNVRPLLDCTGNFLSRSASPNDSPELEESFVDATGSPVSPTLLRSTCGKRIHESQGRNLSSEDDLCEETFQQIGTRFANRLNEAIFEAFPPTYTFGIIN